uniref:Uncharacterized protein n=1 Tax=Anguilla anguilla TaxID=7936 RepID=A0A0E9W641_ANGAN
MVLEVSINSAMLLHKRRVRELSFFAVWCLGVLLSVTISTYGLNQDVCLQRTATSSAGSRVEKLYSSTHSPLPVSFKTNIYTK